MRTHHPDNERIKRRYLIHLKETIAKAHRPTRAPTISQIRHVLAGMEGTSDVARRDRALVAFLTVTGARCSALASFRLRHVDPERRVLFQDARTVRTKFSKTFETWFFPVGEDIEEIVIDWLRFLTEEKLWGLDDPLFPSTQVGSQCEWPLRAHRTSARALEQYGANPRDRARCIRARRNTRTQSSQLPQCAGHPRTRKMQKLG